MRTPLVYAWPEGIPSSAQTLREIRLLHSQQIQALASSDLHHRHVVLLRDIRDAPQLCGRGHASTHARHHGKRSVLLNIGVDAIVDEASRAILFMVSAPQHVQHVAQRGLANLAALAVTVDVQNLLHRLQLLPAHDFAKLLVGERQAGAQRSSGLLLKFGHHRAQQLLA